MTWTLREERRQVVAGADARRGFALGGNGTAEFASAADTTRRPVGAHVPTPPGFAECATCPHAYRPACSTGRRRGFVRVESTVMESPYSSFILFILALQANDLSTAGR